jgi:hypothetical protein
MSALFQDPYFTSLPDQRYQSMGKGYGGDDNEDGGDGNED